MVPEANPYTRRARRLVTLRRAVGVVLVLGVAAVTAVYLLRRRAVPAPKAPVLGIEVQQSAAGVDISKSVNGRPVFRVFAARADKLRGDGLDELRQVRILVYDQQGRNADEISGNSFRYNESSGDLDADGEVHIQLQNQVQISAHGLRYNVKQGTGSISQGVQLGLGSARGSAAAVRLNSRTGVVDLSGGVQLQWARPGRPLMSLRSQSAELRREQDGVVAVSLQGQAQLRQGTESLTADHFVALVQPGYALRDLDAYGHVVAVDATASDPLRVAADTAHAGFDPATQTLRHLVLAGHVTAGQTQKVRGARLERQLRAGQLELVFAAGNQLQALAARQGAELIETGAETQSLAAPEIDFRFRAGAGGTAAAARVSALRAILTRGRTRLVRGPLRAEADTLDIALRADQQPRSVTASGQVEVQQQGAGPERTSSSQELEIQFGEGAHPQPELVRESGGVRLRQGDRNVRAQSLVYTPADGKAVLSGGVTASDPQAILTAAAATWVSHRDGSATLSASAPAPEPLALSLAPGTDVALPGGGAKASGRSVVVTARSLRWEQPSGPPPAARGGFRGRAVFTGGVRVLQAPDLLRADQLTLTAGAGALPAQVEAQGHVQTEFVTSGRGTPAAIPAVLTTGPAASSARAVRIQAESLHYSQPQQVARYRGAVTLQVSNATLSAPQLSVFFSGGSGTPTLERAVASGGVEIRQPGRRAQAQELSFDFAHNLVRLEGGPPSIFDAEHGKISGDPLTFSLTNDEIQVGGKHGTRVFGQTHGHN